MPGIIVGLDRKDSYISDQTQSKRSVSYKVRAPTRHYAYTYKNTSTSTRSLTRTRTRCPSRIPPKQAYDMLRPDCQPNTQEKYQIGSARETINHGDDAFESEVFSSDGASTNRTAKTAKTWSATSGENFSMTLPLHGGMDMRQYEDIMSRVETHEDEWDEHAEWDAYDQWPQHDAG